MKAYITVVVLILVSFTSKGQIYVKNNHNSVFRVALAYYENGSMFNGWITKGWFEVQPGEEKEILHYNPTGKILYYYASSDDIIINGNHLYLINSTEVFTIKDADKETTYTKNPTYLWYGFREIQRGMSNTLKNKFTIELGK
jgi:uncharacterized membrane protein